MYTVVLGIRVHLYTVMLGICIHLYTVVLGIRIHMYAVMLGICILSHIQCLPIYAYSNTYTYVYSVLYSASIRTYTIIPVYTFNCITFF